MIAWFAHNSVAANILMVSILVAGIFSYSNLVPLEILPSTEPNSISVNMKYRGATPEDIESGISIRIEEAIQDLQGIENVVSHSFEGGATINIEVSTKSKPRELLADVKNRIDSISTFPIDAEKPVVSLSEPLREVIGVTLSSSYGENEVRELSEKIREDLQSISGITTVELVGVRDYEISIEISKSKLDQYDLTIEEISKAIRDSSVDISSGSLKTLGGEILVRSKGQAYSKKDFSKIHINTLEDGSILNLEDVASIVDRFEETPVRTRFNGENAILLEVYRVGQESAIEIANEVKDYIKEYQATMPLGYTLSYWDDDSKSVVNRISTLTTSAIQGGILVLILLSLFLRPAIALWVCIGIPVSFFGAFFIMPLLGVSLNVFSLFGFIIALGIVVDDAIVTGENIYSHIKNHGEGVDVVIGGTQEISTPVTFGVLTTIAAFVPFFFLEGNRSEFFNQIPYVVIPILIFSLIESKLVLPAHLKSLKSRGRDRATKFDMCQRKISDGLEKFIEKYYQPVLNYSIENKFSVIILSFSILFLVISIVLSGWVKFTFFPRIPGETVRATLIMPVGTPFEITNLYIDRLTLHAQDLQKKYTDVNSQESLITNIFSTTGRKGGNGHLGNVRFEMVPFDERTHPITSKQLTHEWRQLVGDIPGAESISFRFERGWSSSPIDVQLSGASYDALSKVSEILKGRLDEYPTVFDIGDSLSDGKEELLIELTDRGRTLGFSRLEVSMQVRDALFGAEVQRIQRGRDDVRVMIRLPKDERASLTSLENLTIVSSNGKTAPLGQIAKLASSKGPASIQRINHYRTVNVTADVDKSNTDMRALESDLSAYLDSLLLQYPGVIYSLEGESKEQRDTLSSLSWAVVFVIFAIYALLAIPFKSYLQPIIVMSVIPFSMLGAFLGHFLLGFDLTVLSLLGMLALVGVVVNDSLVLVDYINKKYKKSGELMPAIITAGVARFRPVFLTSLTTFLGLLPLLFEQSTQAQFLIPMAISLGFGILFSTVTTLILVPINYILIDQCRNYLKEVFNRRLRFTKI